MKDEILSVLAIGQSNMAGRGILGEVPQTDNPDCLMFRMADWRPLRDPVNVDRNVTEGAFRSGVGPQSGFADELSRLTDARIGMIPCADGGTKVCKWMPGRPLFEHAVMQTELAKRSSRLAGIIWHQGESDARSTDPEEYKAGLIRLLTELRRRLGAETLPLVLGEISEHITEEWRIPLDGIRAVNRAIREAAEVLPRCAVVSVQDLEIQADGVHFSARAQRILGKRYAAAFYYLMKEEENMMKKVDELTVKIFPTRGEMGTCAAEDIAACIKRLLSEKETINMIFAAAPSQNDVLKALTEDDSIEWNRINAFHMDEYVGISPDEPAGFAHYLKDAIFNKLPFRSVNTLDCTADPKEEAARYSKLLAENPVDIVCMGIGENGHIAFNDPGVADFNDPYLVKEVELDEVCRMQQVHDGCFPSIDKVPRTALTLTVPALAAAPFHFCVVPCATKARAVKNTVEGPVTVAVPATVLRTLPGSILYADAEAAALLEA